MKETKKIFIMALSVAVISLISYGTVSAAVEKYKIVDKRGGKRAKAPKWMNKSQSALEKDYEGKYAFVIKGRGKDLDFVEQWAKRVNAGAEVAQLLSRQVSDLTAGSQYGTDDSFQQTMESLTTSMSKAKIVGLRFEDEFWQLKQFTSGNRKGQTEYEYSVLYLIDRANIDRLLANEMEKALTGANSQTKQRVKEAMDSLIIESGGLEEE